MSVTKTFMTNLRRTMFEEGLTAKDVAEKSGVSRAYLSQLSHEKSSNLSLELAKSLADAVGMALADMVTPIPCTHVFIRLVGGATAECRVCGAELAIELRERTEAQP